MSSASDSKNAARRPALRDDLKLLRGPVTENGSPTWTLHDPVRNAFFRIGRREFELLSRWEMPVEDMMSAIGRETTISATAADVEALHRFLAGSNLLRPDHPDVNRQLLQKAKAPPENPFRRLLLNYLFFRVPLVRPDTFLKRTLPWVRLAVMPVRLLLPPAFLLALFVLLRQWPAFIHTFTYFFTLQGLLLYALAIFGAKVAHELAHAYVARHFGLRVPTLGVAFMVLWPILYTDNTEAWRVRQRSARMRIVAAGILAELAIAVMATLFWAVLPDGPLRSAFFVLASATWISSLIINSMPFLRFDGYYFLSDWLDIPNLHHRSAAFGRWYLRRFLLGVDHPAPEVCSSGRQAFLILFAYATWIYRFFLFTGIALLVYHLFFKALGLFLFFVEMAWFIGRPVMSELRTWPGLVEETGLTRQNLVFAVGVLVLLMVLILPVKGRVHVPALLKPGTGSGIYSPAAARIEAVHVANGQSVTAGAPLFDLVSPDLEHQIRLTNTRVNLLEAQIRRQAATRRLREQGRVLQQQLAEARTALDGYQQQAARLVVRAATDGIIVDMPDDIRPGRWVNPARQLALLINRRKPEIEGLVPEAVLGRISPGAQACFYPDVPERPVVKGVLSFIDTTGIRFLEEPCLASVYGGAVPVIPVGDNLAVQQSLYRVGMKIKTEKPLYFQETAGRLCLRARPRSLLVQSWRRLVALVIRESGF